MYPHIFEILENNFSDPALPYSSDIKTRILVYPSKTYLLQPESPVNVWSYAGLSSDTRTRGFVPPQNEDERFLMRRVEELCRTAMQRGIPRATGFLSDREQALAQAALNREGCDFARFQGGWPDAERKVLCIEPPDSWPEEPVAVQIGRASCRERV